jgi:transposase-like protein
VPSSKPPYPPEFRREALELMRVSGKPVTQVARDLGVSEQRRCMSGAVRLRSTRASVRV